MRTVLRLAFAIALAHAAVAQQTLVVDPSGAGGYFTTVAAALAAAGPGDTVLVRGGVYGGTVFPAGPLQLVGDPAYPRPTISGVDVMPGAGGGVSLVRFNVTSTRIYGDAAFDDVTGLSCRVYSGNAVLTACSFQPECLVFGGNAVLNRCTLTGRNAYHIQTMWQCVSYPATPGLEVLGGTVALANCTLTGGNAGILCASVPGAAAPALTINGAAVQATRSHLGSPGAPAVSVAGGTFEYDPSTTFAGSGSPPGSVRFLPATDGTSALTGSAITVQLQTQPNLAALVVGSIGRGTPAPSPLGAIWFDPSAYVVLAFGATDANGMLTATIPVPLGVQRGTALTLQGGAIPPAPGVATAGTPVVLHVQ